MRILNETGIAEAAGEPLPVVDLACEFDIPESHVQLMVEAVADRGLILSSDEHGLEPATLTRSGRQYIERQGEVPGDVLRYLPNWIDDLDARDALIVAGDILVDCALADFFDDRLSFARLHVPRAFALAIDEEDAESLYCAMIAVITRLSCGQPPACVAEEIMAVALMREAECWLDLRVHHGELDCDRAEEAIGALDGLFDLLGDDDVLELFDMKEPADAALANHDPNLRQAGVVDQRLEAWFVPFTNGVISTGHLLPRT